MIKLDDFRQRYRDAVEQWLAQSREESLSLAYEIGRQALHDGLGILDLATLHREVVAMVIGGPLPTELALGELMLELFSPFEMTLLGCRASNEELRRLNQLLAEQKSQLELANRNLDAFSYSVSHDLRSPVRRVRAFSALLSKRWQSEENAATDQRYLQAISNGAQQMHEMIEGLLELSRFSLGKISLSRLNITKMAEEVFLEITDVASERKVEFQVQGDVWANGDRSLIRIVLQNLIGNAWKFTSKKEKGVIEFGRFGSNFFVRDNGAGFEEEYASRLFSPFQRLHSDSEFEGTGVGLATVQRIIERHSGRVWAEAKVEEGATFWFTLGAD